MLLTFALVLAAVLSLAEGKFPYSRCISYKPADSPYTFDLASTTQAADGSTYTGTFILNSKASTPLTAGACYDAIQKQGVNKVMLDTSDICIGHVKVYIDGKYAPACKAQKAPHVNGTYIPLILKPAVLSGGTNITVIGSGPCANPSTLFNSDTAFAYRYAIVNHKGVHSKPCCPTDSGSLPTPSPSPTPSPPPAPSGSFPWCFCNTNNYNTPWNIQSYQHVETNATNDYTITIGQQGCSDVSPCCGMDFHKLEFNIGDNCKHSLDKAFLHVNNGLPVSPTPVKVGYVSYGSGALVCKFTDLGLTADTAYGSTIKFSLIKGTACPTIQDWLAQEAYAIFSSSLSCCPLWSFTALGNVGGTIWGQPIPSSLP